LLKKFQGDSVMYYCVTIEPALQGGMVQRATREFEISNCDVIAISLAERFAEQTTFEGPGPDGFCKGHPVKLEAWGEHDTEPRLVKEW